MAPGAAPLSSAAIAVLRAADGVPVIIEVVAETASTNADLTARASAGALTHGPLLRLALHQSAGRGRAGRSWLSSADGSLTFSLAWPFAGPAARLALLTGLPLAVGVALAEALAGLSVPVQLKWPNDIYKDGAKLAGILIETVSAADGRLWAVIGVGLNLVMPSALEAQIDREVASAPWLARMDRNALMAALLDHLTRALVTFDASGFAAFSARWNLLHAWHGQTVRVIDNGAVLHQGVAAGVDDSGRLLLDTDQGRVAVSAGDVSLRLDAGGVA
jgi:BirA family biotin operon repressor/biotin-[acetyl-CoA-carboxylase] ligase